jgi:5-methylcytosine-specific restriction endonuclease McrA
VIRVEEQPAPEDFDTKVRAPGLSALAELTGGKPTITRRGPKRSQLIVAGKPVTRAEDIPPGKLPEFWTRALDDLLERYERRCAYACVYIERVSGAATVDHWEPKSKDPRLAYEWSNFRLACSLMNARKGVHTNIVDPFKVEDGWFELELVDFGVIPGHALRGPQRATVENTIDEFQLNCHECRQLRGEYASAYWEREIRLGYLERRAPFVARELRRQGRLHET